MPKAELDAHDRRPLHERIAADLRDEIMSGDLQPGANLPSTQQLRDRFEVANATVQKALQVLKDERLAVGRPGSAVTVRPHRQETIRPADTGRPAPPGEQYSWLTAATSKGRRGSIELLEVAEVRPPVDVAAALRLDKNGMAVLRRQVFSYDGSPVELVKSYPPRHTVDRVSARVPTQEQFEALRLPSDLPVLRTFRVVYSDDERPIEVTVMAKAGHLYELQYEF